MLFSSTTESRELGKITVLSLVETLLVITAVLCIAIYTQSLLHIAIGACLAPLLLLRSPESTEFGKKWFERFTRMRPMKKENMFVLAYRYSFLLMLSLVIRVGATIRHPILGIQSLPRNWNRSVLCTDLATPLELVPQTGSIRSALRRVAYEDHEAHWGFLLMMFLTMLNIAIIIYCLGSWGTSSFLVVLRWVVIAIFLFDAAICFPGLMCYVLSIAYRLSLKSTAPIWVPLVYVAHVTFDENLSLTARVREIKESTLWKIIRFVSWITLFLFALKLVLLPNVIDWWNNQPWATVLNFYVMPNQLHTWHVAAALNAAFALTGYYLFLERAPRYLSEGAWSDKFVYTGLRIFTFVRGCISIYTIVVGIYLTIVAAASLKFPQWSEKVFPW